MGARATLMIHNLICPNTLRGDRVTHLRLPRRERARRIASTSALLALLTACGPATASDDPSTISDDQLASAASKNSSPSRSSSTTTSPSSTKTTSTPSKTPIHYEVPAAAKEHSVEGAKAFVTFYFQTLEKLDINGGTGVIPKLSTPTCKTCKLQEDNGKELAQTGERLEAQGTVKLSAMAEDPQSTVDTKVLTFTSIMPPAKRLRGSTVLDSSPQTTLKHAVRVVWTTSGWKIDEIGTGN